MVKKQHILLFLFSKKVKAKKIKAIAIDCLIKFSDELKNIK